MLWRKGVMITLLERGENSPPTRFHLNNLKCKSGPKQNAVSVDSSHRVSGLVQRIFCGFLTIAGDYMIPGLIIKQFSLA